MAAALTHRGPDDAGLLGRPRRTGGLRAPPAGRRRPQSRTGTNPWCPPTGAGSSATTARSTTSPSCAVAWSARAWPSGAAPTPRCCSSAVQCWGLDAALEASEGMFALALWDRQRRRAPPGPGPVRREAPLLRLGRRASGLRLGAEGAAPPARASPPSWTGTRWRLYLRHNCIPAPRTVYRGVAKLRPARWSPSTDRPDPGALPAPPRLLVGRGRRWRTPAAARLTGSAGVPGRPGGGRRCPASVAARMVADVPVGAFLSGGVDSSLVVALMQQTSDQPGPHLHRRLRRPGLRRVRRGRRGGRPPRDRSHRCSGSSDGDAAEVIPRLPDIWDEPFGDISQIPMLLVSRLARSEVTVALSGDGGDELFAGYNRHAWLERLWRRCLRRCPTRCAGGPGRPSVRVPPGAGRRGGPGHPGPAGRVGRCGTRPPRWPRWARCWPPPVPRTPICPWSPTGTTPSRWCWASAPHDAAASGPGGVAGARRGSPSRCCGWTWSATCPTTS